MISFNLINPIEKKGLVKLKIYYIIKHISFLIISLTLIISIAFIFSYLLYNNENDTLAENITGELDSLAKEKISSIEAATMDLNRQLIRAESIQAQYIEWTNFLNLFSGSIPEGILLSSIHFDTTNYRFSIAGNALKRENLLGLNSSLEQFEYFTGIQSPFSNLILKENIDFNISGTMTEKIYD